MENLRVQKIRDSIPINAILLPLLSRAAILDRKELAPEVPNMFASKIAYYRTDIADIAKESKEEDLEIKDEKEAYEKNKNMAAVAKQ